MSALAAASHSRAVPADTIDAVLDGQLYISSLACALKVDEEHPELGITHVVSVCTDMVSRGPTHLVFPVLDSEYDNILDHLPAACQFIEDALAAGGRVLVHCVMGVSRSATVVAAYLMKTRHLSPSESLALIRKRRPRIFPNYGFVKQLYVFEACSYAPERTHPAYRSWKRRQKQDVTQFLNVLSDTAVFRPERIYLNTELPSDSDQRRCLVKYMGLSHCLSLSPSDVRSDTLGIDQYHLELPPDSPALLLALPAACDYIRTALADDESRVLVHSRTESVAVLVVAAYIMRNRNISPQKAVQIVRDALPLFEPTANFLNRLETFEACCNAPSPDHTSASFIPSTSTSFTSAPLVGAAKDRPARPTIATPARPVSIVGRS